MDKLKPFNPDSEAVIDRFIEKYAADKVEVGFLPLAGKVEDLTVIVRKDSADVMEIVDLKPWP